MTNWKAWLLIFAVALPLSVHADDTSKNPDRLPSVGISYGGALLDARTPTLNLREHQTDSFFAGDVRVPINNSLTINTSVGSITNLIGPEDAAKTRWHGVTYQVGLRYYLGDK